MGASAALTIPLDPSRPGAGTLDAVPVRSAQGLPEMRPDVPRLFAKTPACGPVSDARLDGDQLTATIGPSSKGLYQIVWSLTYAGSIVQDVPTLVALRGL